MTQEHLITPSPKLVEQWLNEWHNAKVKHTSDLDYIAIQAANWGSNQELEACCEWVSENVYLNHPFSSHDLRAARRPKPPSLKAQALALIDECTDPHGDYLDNNALAIIRRAIESLPD
jgi:hypothetical protein